MTAVLAFVCSALSLAPSLSFALFFNAIGRSTRQHDLLELFRFALQTAAGVTSPIKLGLIFAILIAACIEMSARPA
jgi:hypothetical protein